jgi:hypothetical protein
MFWDKKTAPQQDLAHLGIQDAQLRDAISVAGAAADFSDIDFTVDRRDVYEAGSRQWFEVSGMWRETRVFLEVHAAENVEVLGHFDGRTLSLDDFGLTEADMGELDQRQNQNDFLDFEGKFWMYRFSREMGVFSDGHTTGRGFYAWQFEEQGGKRFLKFRKFEGEPFSASIWVTISPGDITIFRGA